MTKATADTPTLVQVEELVDRATSLEQQAAALADKEQDLTRQLAEHHIAEATGKHTGTKQQLDALTRQRRAVREERADKLAALPVLHARIHTDRERACVAEAERRMTGLARGHGSLRQELDADEVKVQDAAAAYRDAIKRVNARYKALAMLQAEANALADRFDIPAPTFPAVGVPATREGCGEAVLTAQSVAFVAQTHVRTATEQCAHRLRTRRTFQEVADTPSGAILKVAGPVPWSELTAKQRAIVEGRERELQAEAAAAARFAGEASRTLQRTGLG